MNKDAREDHTLRNALLLTGGLAAGGVGGIKLLEKAATKGGKKASVSAEKEVAKAINKEAERKMIHEAAKSDKRKVVRGLDRGNAQIKKESNTTAYEEKIKGMSIKDKAKEIKEVQKFLEGEEIKLKMYEEKNDIANIIKEKKLISEIKQRLAALRGFIS